MSQSTSSKGKVSPAAQLQTRKKSAKASGSSSLKNTYSGFAHLIRQQKWIILGVIGLLFILVIIILLLMLLSAPSPEAPPELPRGGTQAPPLGPIIHLFGEGLSFPESLYWDNTSLYFVDAVAGYFYRWSPENGTSTYDYSRADFSSIKSTLRRRHRDHRSYYLKFIYPLQGAEFYGGYGSALISIRWERPWSNFVARAEWEAEICESSREISAAIVTPYGSLIFVCKDIEVDDSSHVTFKRFANNNVENLEMWCFLESSKLMAQHRLVTGMAFDNDGHRLFMVDTRTRAVIKWNYQILDKVEQISTPELVWKFEISDGRPYDVACDGDNFLWVALIDTNKLIQISTSEKLPSQKASYPVPGRITVGLCVGLNLLGPYIIISTGKESPPNLDLKNVQNQYSIGGVYFLNKTVKRVNIRRLQRKKFLLKLRANTRRRYIDISARCHYI